MTRGQKNTISEHKLTEICRVQVSEVYLALNNSELILKFPACVCLPAVLCIRIRNYL
jgi:hypothetical protein